MFSGKDINFTDRTIKESLKMVVLCLSLFRFPRGGREQLHFESVVGFLLGAPNNVVSTETYPSLYELRECQ
jgi:hypothetical protein